MILAAAVLLFPFARPLYAWDAPEHKLIAKMAVSCLPDALKAFYTKNSRSLLKQVNQPDIDRRKDWNEKPRHFMNLDSYDTFPFAGIPPAYDEALERYGRKALFYYGVLPYAVSDSSRWLARAFRAGDREGIIRLSAYLCHYAADACMPLHSTRNYDGYAEKPDNLHANYEMLAVRRALKKGLKPIEHPPLLLSGDGIGYAVLEALKAGYLQSLALLEADGRALKADPGQRRGYLGALTEGTKAITEEAVNRSAALSADLLYSAWMEAGSPLLK